MADEKMWGAEPFWGLGYEWDPDWTLTDRQKELRGKLIELCEKEMRANAKRSDDELLFPRRNLELMGEHGFSPSPSPRSTAASARTTSGSRWSARPWPATAARRRPCAT
jgi:hypothetical protein